MSSLDIFNISGSKITPRITENLLHKLRVIEHHLHHRILIKHAFQHRVLFDHVPQRIRILHEILHHAHGLWVVEELVYFLLVYGTRHGTHILRVVNHAVPAKADRHCAAHASGETRWYSGDCLISVVLLGGLRFLIYY